MNPVPQGNIAALLGRLPPLETALLGKSQQYFVGRLHTSSCSNGTMNDAARCFCLILFSCCSNETCLAPYISLCPYHLSLPPRLFSLPFLLNNLSPTLSLSLSLSLPPPLPPLLSIPFSLSSSPSPVTSVSRVLFLHTQREALQEAVALLGPTALWVPDTCCPAQLAPSAPQKVIFKNGMISRTHSC